MSHSIKFPTSFYGFDSETANCPVCGFEYVHIDAVTVLTASGEGTTVTACGEDEKSHIHENPPRPIGDVGRRHVIRLHGECENGHTFHLDLRQHKGVTLTRIVVEQ